MKKLSIIVFLLTFNLFATELEHMYNACENKKMATACFKLGILFEQGLGLQKDLNLAKAYYKKSCQLNYSDACSALKKINGK